MDRIDSGNIRDNRHLFPQIALPSLDEQEYGKAKSYADKIEARYAKAKIHVDKPTQSILAKAFRGELVPQDPSDEPANKLLERIKKKVGKNL